MQRPPFAPLPFVGRRDEIQALTDRLEHVRSSRQGACVFIAGEPGMGKTRLVDEFLGSLAGRKPRPVVATGSALEGSVDPYLPMISAMESLAASGNLQARAILDTLRRVTAGAGAGSTGAGTGAGAGTLAAGVEALPELVRTVLGGVPPGQSSVLVLEDLHWADAATVGVLVGLVHSLPDMPVLLVGTYRPEFLVGVGPVPAFAVSRDQLECAPSVTVRMLRPFGPEEVGMVLRRVADPADLPSDFAGHLVQRSAGVPLFLEEIIRQLRATGHLSVAKGRWVGRPGLRTAPLPASVASAMDQRVARLKAPARTLAELVAATRDDVRAEVLSRAMGTGFATAAKDLLGSRLLLRPRGRYRFAHHLIKDAVARSTPPTRLPELHRRLAEAMEHEDPDPGPLAYHYAKAGMPDRAARAAVIAGEHALEIQADDAAIAYLTIALDAARAAGSMAPEEVARLLKERATALLRAGRYLAAAEDATRGLALGAAGTLEAELRVTHADALLHRGDFAGAAAAARSALPDLSKVRAWRSEVECRRILCHAAWRLGDFRSALDYIREGRRIAEANDDERLAAVAISGGATILMDLGRYQEAIDQFRQAVVLLELVGKAEDVAVTLNNLGAVYRNLGDWEAGLRLFEECSDRSRTAHYPLGVVYGLKNAAYCYAQLGRFEQADRACDEAFKIFQLLERRDGISDSYLVYGVIHRLRREWASAASFFETALEIARELRIPSREGDILYEYGLLDRDRGEPGRSRERLEAASVIFQRLGAAARAERARDVLAGLPALPA